MRTGARILVDQLGVHGVDTAFCVPGETYLAAPDALRDAPPRLVVARHEAGAANMAEAYGKLTGKPGVCLVTRAPGATHAAVGIHTASQDSTPLVLFVGQVPRSHLGREAFQELDYPRMYRQMAKRGGGGWSERAGIDLIAFAEASNLPVAASFRRQDYVDNRSPVYAGALTIGMDPALAQRVSEADVLLAVGTRLGEIATQGYTLVEPPRPRQTLVHVHADPDELGRVYEAELQINSGSSQFAAAARALEPLDGSRRAPWTEDARADYHANLQHDPAPGDLDLADVLLHMRERLPDDAILTSGAGNYTVWCHRFFELRRYRTQLAPCSGAMGYGIPAAIAAKIVHPERVVVCVSGDGDFMMSGHELASATREGAAIVVLVVINGMYGTIRMHQEQSFPGRDVGTDLVNPDFAAYSQAFGAYGETVTETAAFPDAFERAIAAGIPAVLELPIDPDAVNPRTTLTANR